MSPRAAARLETLAFHDVYDYVAGKADWGAAGLPLAGATEHAGDRVVGGVPTCGLGERLRAVQERVRASGWDSCFVVTDDGVVLGRLGGSALSRTDDVVVEEAMAPGPSTIRPSAALDAIRRRMRERNLSTYPVTTSDGKLVGLLRVDE